MRLMRLLAPKIPKSPPSRQTPRDALFEAAPGGTVPGTWFGPRRLAQATLEGTYVDVEHPDSFAALRRLFLSRAREVGMADFDGTAIGNSEPRELTQEMSRYLWETTMRDGVRFESRFGNGLQLFAIFERTSMSSAGRSTLLTGTSDGPIPSGSRDFTRTLTLHNLTIDVTRWQIAPGPRAHQ